VQKKAAPTLFLGSLDNTHMEGGAPSLHHPLSGDFVLADKEFVAASGPERVSTSCGRDRVRTRRARRSQHAAEAPKAAPWVQLDRGSGLEGVPALILHRL
jgi:hypothetical protein